MLIEKRERKLPLHFNKAFKDLFEEEEMISDIVYECFFGDPRWLSDGDICLPNEINHYLSNENFPSKLLFHAETGIVVGQSYYVNGKLHRKDGPAAIIYFPLYEEYYLEDKFIGANLNLYTEEDIKNYLILK